GRSRRGGWPGWPPLLARHHRSDRASRRSTAARASPASPRARPLRRHASLPSGTRVGGLAPCRPRRARLAWLPGSANRASSARTAFWISPLVYALYGRLDLIV